MSTTTLDPQFLAACLLMSGFKDAKMRKAKAALLYMALQQREFTAAELPGEVVEGSRHISGAAAGSLVGAEKLLIVVRREKSHRPNAKGRKVDVFRLAPGRYATAVAWLRANNCPVPGNVGDQLPLGT